MLILPLAFLLALLPETAAAHNAFGDMGGFNNGFLHPLTTIQHVLALLGLGAVLIFNRDKGDRALAGVLLGFIAGYAAAVMAGPFGFAPAAIAIATIVMGLTAASGHKLRLPLLLALVTLTGFSMGMDTGDETATLGQHSAFVLGACISLTIVQGYALWTAMAVRKDWQKIVVRIAGSWIATISLLYVAVEFSAKK
ncbi:MAG TPA: HupE/UreJ family protein [Candidatus Peribacteria bacterium]|nr:HupE/UreJ family protein [Candidatus Peribacteria bacterium]